MHGICGFIDFTKNTISGGETISGNRHIGEHSLFIQLCGGEKPVHRTVEGYDFSIAYSGTLCGRAEEAEKLKACGYSLITDSEAETVLYTYIHYGEECAKRLRGNFVFAVCDCMRQRVFLCCRGQELTYMRDGERVLFSSDERLLFEMAKKPLTADTDGLRRIFIHGCDCGVLKNVYCLPSEHYMIITRRGAAVKQYAETPETDTETAKKAFPVFRALLKQSVSDTLISDDTASETDYIDFMRRRNARITDIFTSPCRFENGDYKDMLKHGLMRAVRDGAAPVTALCGEDKLYGYIRSEDFSSAAAEFIIRINNLLYGARIV